MEDNTQAAQALSKKDEAYVRIKDRIISGEYKPGSLLVERTLSDSLDMSRTPIRAALMDLCHTGLATFVPGKGIYVSVIGRRDIEEIYEIRALLDPAVLLSFMKQATRDQVAMLRTFADNMRDAVRMENTGMLIENDVNFHQYYTDYCGNARMTLGAVAPVPMRRKKAEAYLIGRKPSGETALGAAKLALEGALPLSGNAYKIDVAETLVRRSLDWSGKDE